MLGHKADLGFMAARAPTCGGCAGFQSDLQAAGLVVAYSYVSLTEVSEYAAGHPRRDEADPAVSHAAAGRDDRRSASTRCPSGAGTPRAPTGSPCPFEERKALMHGHGAVGPHLRRSDRPAHHRLDRHRRLGVGGHPVRRAPRRPEGLRLHHALRRGLGPLRRVRALPDRDGRLRSRRSWPRCAPDE